jgi:Aldose 1-epimerase
MIALPPRATGLIRAIPQRNCYSALSQHFPDSPNHSEFPSTELKPGQRFQSVTIFQSSALSTRATNVAEKPVFWDGMNT